MSIGVVYVESDRQMHQVMDKILKGQGHTLRCFDCALEALNDPQTLMAYVIMIDLDMPNIDLDHYRRRFKNHSIALVTGREVSAAECEQYAKKGLGPIFKKPLDRLELCAFIQKTFDQVKAA